MSGSYLLSIFGAADQTSALGPGGRITLYKTSIDNAARDTARIRKDPAVIRDLARLDRVVAQAKTPADIFKDPQAVRVLLQGLGLGDQVANIGLAKQALLSDTSKPGSLASRLSDQRWLAAAKQLAFAGTGLKTLQGQKVRDTIAGGLVEYNHVSKIETQSQAVADALTVRNMKNGETPSVYTVLGDKVLRRVVQTLGNLPQQLAVQSVEAQARQVEAHVKLSDFADARKREKLIQRYLTLAEDNAAADTTPEALIAKL